MSGNFFSFTLLFLGLSVGVLGTLIGAGGGFILVPLLLFLFPQLPPEKITCISLAVVFFNATSGSLAYAQKRRIDYKAALIYSAVAIPGAFFGVQLTHQVQRGQFHTIFGFFLTVISTFLIVSSFYGRFRKVNASQAQKFSRTLTERNKKTHKLPGVGILGTALSAIVGVLSSFLGIGGGVIHVPALITLLGYPVHIATATSHFILAITAFFGLLTHVLGGDFAGIERYALLLAPSAFVGAQIGARLSDKVSGDWILRCLAIGLALVGIRLILVG